MATSISTDMMPERVRSSGELPTGQEGQRKLQLPTMSMSKTNCGFLFAVMGALSSAVAPGRSAESRIAAGTIRNRGL